MSKQLQFELWQECNSKCKFCYLGKENCYTPNEIKLQSLQNALDKISDLSIYKEYDTLSYLGGEFFQGQLNTPEIKSKFMELMKKTAWLYEHNYIKHVWIYATLTIGDQKDLYETLNLFNKKDELWILTSYDTIGRFHTQKMLDNWDYHMKNIHNLYPEIKFNITTILSEDCIDKYLNDNLSFKKMMEEYHCSFFFKQCGNGPYSKEEMNTILPHFFPPRDKFIDFLQKFRNEENDEMWNKLFNIHYRADSLYRNFNDKNHQMELNVRHKDSLNEIENNNKDEMETNDCGHLKVYAAYIDCDDCVLCDKLMIEELLK